MDEQREVRLIGGNEGETAVFTLFEEEDGRCRLRCDYRGKTAERTSTDFFQSLSELRDVLAEENLVPFCYGASLNVFPSGMARDMGQGLRAYRLVRGRHSRMTDLVDIFSEGDDVALASVKAQEAFYKDWLAAPRV